ncbi:MAG: YegP family protein [Chitinophagaceae bacterium]
MPLIKILDSTDGQFFSRIVADNGETIYSSETYTRKEKCVSTASIIAGPTGWPVGDFTQRKKRSVNETKKSGD